ncbi:HpcH/HpaI aldolase/citrate lyase family protein [Rhodococcus jostii]|uniref:Citrate lyase subunit beta / citryl-CoA lyase n=1 Tax=Rhodococcus jostii TaxID=132919 RepID=A0A1H5F2R7_RHOJO|nr:aldolase/citrate lyase family protein [Rhodococcus jostii]SED97574.1 citrate lyase subunit beta / citryl-CoA lyase [Rhodococcus jostii]
MTLTSSAPAVAVPATHARSWLLVAGSRPDEFAAATNSAADAVIFDLEDGVVPSSKTKARESVMRFLAGGGTGWVRINNATTTDWNADLDAIRGLPGLRGVMLAKTESADQVDRTAAEVPHTPILALVESARGVEFAFGIASADATTRIAFGTGDFRRDTDAGAEPDALAYARGRLVVASRAAGLPGPIDGPCLTGEPDLSEALAVTRSMGMTGKLCMHVGDTAIVNRELSPLQSDVAWAAEVIAHLGAQGENIADGSDRPKLARALRITHLADVFSVSA